MDIQELPCEYPESSQAPSLSGDESPSDQSPLSSSLSSLDPRGFRNGQASQPNDAFIAVMGVTGSGTSIVDVYPYKVSADFTVYLIDTPGFDDTGKTDSDVLNEIAMWLSDSYQHNICLHGIIYLHRISDVRMQGSAKKNLVTFKKLCGENALRKVILASTMWDKTPLDEATMREQELKDTPEFWGWMLEKGSSCHRYDNTADSARQIILSLANHEAPIATDLQKQIVDEGLTLDETSAGQELASEILKERERLDEVRQELEAQIKAAKEQHDRDTQEVLQEERDRYTDMIQKAEKNTENLKSTMENLIAKRDQRVAEMKEQIQELQAKNEETLQHMKMKALELEREKAKLQQQQLQPHQQTRPDQQLVLLGPRQSNLRTAGQNQQKGEVKNPPTRVWFSISLTKSFYFLLSPECWSCNTVKLQEFQAGNRIEVGCMSTANDQVATWIARHANSTWRISAVFEHHYPDFAKNIRLYGLENLDVCTLGPDQAYYARWLDGSWSSSASDAFNQTITEVTKNGHKVAAVSLGYGGSFFISYGSGSRYLEWNYQLEGYYRSLDRFLRSQTRMGKGISIHAITLDPHSQTDYLVVFTFDTRRGADKPKNKLYCSNRATRQAIDDWWETTKERRESS
ncbi:hypothetical protein FSARC_10271 [Fusarium sarcochroum]|uniref:G domain-containing protein n=1 Tax=Fusarium sarcochroum TaxID=1208366 RepID=A0A8H4TNM9_9HYPO|nr:hypothetical protein FSARC_10271 [Fusarium sarcochroum]